MKTVDSAQAKIQPVLMILTHSFRGVKNLLITLRCLERSTDLRSFKQIYLLANCTFGEHELLIRKYVKKYPGLFQDVHCSPPGHNPCVAHTFNRCQDELAEHIPLEQIYHFLMSQEGALPKRVFA